MSLAIVNGSSPQSGITLSVEPYVEALQSLGHQVTWYQCVDAGQRADTRPGGVTVRGAGIPIESLEMGANRLWVFPRRLRKIPESCVVLSDPTLIRVARFHPHTVVLVHDLLPLTAYADRADARWMFRYLLPRLRAVPRVIVATATMRDELTRRGVPPDRIRVVPYTHRLGTHPDHIDRSVERVRERREVRVLFVGTDRPFKNIDFVLRLAKAMEASQSGVRFVFTLLSRLKPSTWERIGSLRVGNLRVQQNVLSTSPLYEQCDVLVNASLHEGFGRPLMEAMAYGLPIVANRIPPFIEILADSAILLDVGRLPDWVAALESLGDPDVLRQHAQRSLERSAAFSPETFRTRVADAFTDLPT